MNSDGTEEFIFIFHNAHDAIMGERTLLVAGIDVRVMPVPSCLGSSCGIALRVNPEEAEKAGTLLGQTIKGIYRHPLAAGDTERFIPWNPGFWNLGFWNPGFPESLSAWFDRKLFGTRGSPDPVVVTVIGSGGKTSLILHLARYFASKPDGLRPHSVLVTTTTKMFPFTGTESLPGVDTAGRLNQKTGKLEAPPPEELAERAASYDLVLIEGDGSRGLPLKGWAEYEPVVPPFTTVTVGILPLWPLGKPVSEGLIHRLPLFCALTGAATGDALEPAHLVTVIAGSGTGKSLFTAAAGRKILFFNQIEDETSVFQAEKLAALLPEDFRLGLHGIIAGSIRQDRLVLQA